jgi:uncharacterized membrane protein YjjB (DUF3815 family)
MTVVLADFDPAMLLSFCVLLLAGAALIFCLAAAGVLALGKERRAVRGFLIAAGVVTCVGILLARLALTLGKRLHMV